MNKKIFFESLKAILVGFLIGLFIMYFKGSNSFTIPFICALIALSFHSRNNSYQSKK